MPNPNAIVGRITRIEPSPDPDERGALSIVVGGEERSLRLDPSDTRSADFAQVLDGLSKQGLPVYLEIDPATSSVTRLLIPNVTRIANLRPLDEGILSVEFQLSHGRHVLRQNLPDYEEFERQLRVALDSRAPLIITEDDAHTIIDVRGFTPDPEGPLPPYPFPDVPPRVPPRPPFPFNWIKLIIDWLWRPWWPWRLWFRCISMTRAQLVFDAMNATSCAPLTVPPPCISFLYPDDGCWARAHEMCRLMIGMGHAPKKVWISGSLYVSTRNSPLCGVWWNWHVAPTLCVRGPGLLQSQQMVIDPSLFTTPVSKATWKGIQGDPGATLTDTAASDYLWGTLDPTYVLTNDRLAYYRLQLQIRAMSSGPPPYASCP